MERQRLSFTTVLLLSIPPVLWAGNAIIGRLVRDAMPPMTLNLLRWSIALLILLVLGRAALRPGSGVLRNWRRYALLGLLGIGLYNSMQYLALTTSSPLSRSRGARSAAPCCRLPACWSSCAGAVWPSWQRCAWWRAT